MPPKKVFKPKQKKSATQRKLKKAKNDDNNNENDIENNNNENDIENNNNENDNYEDGNKENGNNDNDNEIKEKISEITSKTENDNENSNTMKKKVESDDSDNKSSDSNIKKPSSKNTKNSTFQPKFKSKKVHKFVPKANNKEQRTNKISAKSKKENDKEDDEEDLNKKPIKPSPENPAILSTAENDFKKSHSDKNENPKNENIKKDNKNIKKEKENIKSENDDNKRKSSNSEIENKNVKFDSKNDKIVKTPKNSQIKRESSFNPIHEKNSNIFMTSTKSTGHLNMLKPAPGASSPKNAKFWTQGKLSIWIIDRILKSLQLSPKNIQPHELYSCIPKDFDLSPKNIQPHTLFTLNYDFNLSDAFTQYIVNVFSFFHVNLIKASNLQDIIYSKHTFFISQPFTFDQQKDIFLIPDYFMNFSLDRFHYNTEIKRKNVCLPVAIFYTTNVENSVFFYENPTWKKICIDNRRENEMVYQPSIPSKANCIIIYKKVNEFLFPCENKM
ncbi:hypothetical protein TRFO_26169 [Tritrichomonas foetus]|uniref:Uncharacterized protein n=1 Tax=Tritrichomonas foetus TaxID=1144522 RepID=A0A1J4K863_9EUKA|nr:hypothetical protein TRFO_26169 [Tritrichomonas foetus]|eukprot:OHT05900.1 hypothetical protein TRFO_26169 [Tritrichomonas foetus]